MNKAELITAIAEETKQTKADTEKFLNAFTNVVTNTLAGGHKVQITGFGTFDVAERAERTGRNPVTNEAMLIPASKHPKFKAGKILKNSINF